MGSAAAAPRASLAACNPSRSDSGLTAEGGGGRDGPTDTGAAELSVDLGVVRADEVATDDGEDATGPDSCDKWTSELFGTDVKE